MDERRVELHEKLCSILGSRNVYYQPPESVKLSYPCFVYHLSNGSVFHADNKRYRFVKSYDVIYIDKNPDNDMVNKLLESDLDYVRYGNYYPADNLNHYTFVIYW